MNQYFEPVLLNGKRQPLRELSFDDAIGIAAIPEHLNEVRITRFLAGVLGDRPLALMMTAQERYYVLLSYLSQQSADSAISTDIQYADYLRTGEPQVSNDDGAVQVQHLTGAMVEFLESLCSGVADWLLTQMALQMAVPSIEVCSKFVSTTLSEQDLHAETMRRIEAIKKLPLSEFERVYRAYKSQHDAIHTLVRLSYDKDGLTVIGGADDAPARFRPSAALYGVTAELERLVNHASEATGGGYPDVAA